MAIKFNIGDVVNSHVQVQFNLATAEVGKLSYTARSPFFYSRKFGRGIISCSKI